MQAFSVFAYFLKIIRFMHVAVLVSVVSFVGEYTFVVG